MSVWQAGKLDIKCSMAILRRALINIVPEWEQYINTDNSGSLRIYDYLGNEMSGEGYHILIPGSGNPNLSKAPGLKYNDVGLRQNSDGSWDIQVDESGLTTISNLEGNIAGEIAQMKAKAVAKLRGYNIINQGNDENLSFVEIECDVSQIKELA